MFQYIFVDNNVRDPKGKVLTKGRMAAQISHVSVKATQYFLQEGSQAMRDYVTPPAVNGDEAASKHLQRFDMKTVICKTNKGVPLAKVQESLEKHGLKYVVWNERPEEFDVCLALEPMRDADYPKEARAELKKLTGLY